MNDQKTVFETKFGQIRTLKYIRFSEKLKLLKVPIQVDDKFEFFSKEIQPRHDEAHFVRLFKLIPQARAFNKGHGPLVIKVYYLGYIRSDQTEPTRGEINTFNRSVEKEKKVCQLFENNHTLQSSGFIKQRVVEIEQGEDADWNPGLNDLFIVAMPFYTTFLSTLVKGPSSVHMTCALRREIFIQLLHQLKVGREHNYYYMDIKPSNIAVNVFREEKDVKGRDSTRLIARFADLNSVDIYTYQPLLFSHGVDGSKYPLANVFLWLIYSIGRATQNQNQKQKQNIFETRLRNILRRDFSLFHYPSETASKRSHGISSSSMLLYLVNTLYNLMHPLFFSQSGFTDEAEKQFCQQVLDVAFTDDEKPYIYLNELNPLLTSSCSYSSSSSPVPPSQISHGNSFEYLLLILLSA